MYNFPWYHDDYFRPNTFFNSGVIDLKRVAERSRIPIAENVIPKIAHICATPQILLCGAYCSPLRAVFWKSHLQLVDVSGHRSVQL